MTETNQVISNSTDISKKKRDWLVLIAGIYSFLFIGLAVLGFVTRMETVIREQESIPVQVTIWDSAIRNTISWLLLYSILAPILLSILAFIFRRTILGIIMVLVVFVGYPALAFGLFFTNPMPWDIVDQKVGPDGRTYCFAFHCCDKHLIRLENRTRFSQTFKVISWNPGDSNAFIIRPESGPFGEYKLYITKSGLVICLCYTECYTAYDIHTKRVWDLHSDFSELSPFCLLENGSKPFQPDVDKFYGQIIDSTTGLTLPKEDCLKGELKNPNPYVREIAQKALDKMQKKR